MCAANQRDNTIWSDLRWYDRGMRIQVDDKTTHDNDDKDDTDYKDDKDKDKDDKDDNGKDDDEISVKSG